MPNKPARLCFVLAMLSSSAAWADLSLTQAIDLAIHNNVSVRLASAVSEQARGQALRDASTLLPQILGTAAQTRVFKQNLEALGFKPNGAFETLIGPYNSFDARVSLVQDVFDLSAISKSRAGKKAARAAELEENLAKEQVASAAALTYLDLMRARRAVQAAQSDVDLATSLSRLATDQRHSGLATGVDVTRSQTREANGQLRLIRARTDARQTEIRLARLIGLPLDQPIVTTDELNFSSSTAVPLEQALATAQKDRPELAITTLVFDERNDSYQSARRENAPRIYATGDYGLSGAELDDSKQTGSIGAHLSVPIFTGRDNEGAIKAAEAEMKQAQLRQADTRVQVEEDVRLALDTLSAALDEIAAAKQAHDLATQEMQMSRDRYGAGVGDNIQVVTAQNSLALADDNWIGTIARYQAARINLEMAIGHAQTFSLRQN